MWNNIVGILNYLGPVQTLLLIIAFLFAIVFLIEDWRWGKRGYDPKWKEDRRREMENKYYKHFLR